VKVVHVWNPTVANLSLMALGSSAPEILLNCLETIGTMEKCPGELGPSTIVGSAAFNLLVISGLSIYAVSEENDTDPRRD
jgi:solute carrier family 8 (sodium/calcium exchanger)